MADLPDALLAGLAALGLDGPSFDYSGATSLRGPCPKCGGNRRLLIFLNNGKDWYLRCDGCGFGGFANSLSSAFTQAVGDRDLAELVERLPAFNEAETQEAYHELSTYRLDYRYRENLTVAGVAWWEQQGIPRSLQEFWLLGETKRSFFFRSVSALRQVTCYSIPKYDLDTRALVQIDLRLIGVPSPSDGKYRSLPPPIRPAPFFSLPDYPHLHTGGIAVVVEGSKKAMVLSQLLDMEQQVIGVPSASSWAGIDSALASDTDLEQAYVLLDPDAFEKARDLCCSIGERARLVTSPMKIDDLIQAGALGKAGWETLLRQARKESLFSRQIQASRPTIQTGRARRAVVDDAFLPDPFKLPAKQAGILTTVKENPNDDPTTESPNNQ